MKYVKTLLLLLISSFTDSTIAQDEVNVVISAGLDWSTTIAISPDKKLVAKTFSTAISIWDVKTGRLLRNVMYSNDIMKQADSIYFSPDGTKVKVKMGFSNDFFSVDVLTGASVFSQGPPMDYASYTYRKGNRIVISEYLYSGKSKDLSFKSPDGKSKIIYHKVKNTYGATSVMPYIFEVYIESKGTRVGPVDTTLVGNFTFSADSKYLFDGSGVYNLELGKTVSKLKIVPFTGRSVSFYPNTHIPVTSGIDGVRIWDFPNIHDVAVKNFVNFKTSNDGSKLICESFSFESEEKIFQLLDLKKEKLIGKKVVSKESTIGYDISPDGKYFSFLEMKSNPQSQNGTSNSVHIYSTETGNKVHTFKHCTKAYFTADPNFVLHDTAGFGMFKYDLVKKKAIDFPAEKLDLGAYIVEVSQDHQYIFTSQSVPAEGTTYQLALKAWDTETGGLFYETKISDVYASGIQVSNDHKLLVYGSSTANDVFVIDLVSNKTKYILKGHKACVEESHFSDDDKRLVTSSIDGTRRIWNLENGEEMVSLISTGPKDFAIVNPDQYYYATKGAQRLIHFVKGLEVFPFAQFDLKYNRPDLIIESMEASNLELIEPFRKAYLKRLKRMGFTEEMLDGGFQLPTASIENKNELPITTESSSLELRVNLKDKKFNLDRIIVRVNEVPIHGKMGLDISSEKTKSSSKTIPVELSYGRNRISVSVLNDRGVESIAHSVTISYEQKELDKPKLYLYSIGVSEYLESNYNLGYAAKDAQDISNIFSSHDSYFSDIEITTLKNEQVTIENIEGIKSKLTETNVNDMVCVFYAGHGLLDADLNYFLASYNLNFKNPASKGIPYETLEDLLDGIPARRKLMLIDACHSGEIDKDEIVLVGNELANDGDEDLTFRAIQSEGAQQLGLSNTYELMLELFTDIRKTSGAVIISSAGGLEYAIEGDQWNNGVFTYCFLTGLKNNKADINQDGKVMISEMSSYIREAVYTLTKGRQKPTNRAEAIDSDWRLW
jgi:WD40 repeat protein